MTEQLADGSEGLGSEGGGSEGGGSEGGGSVPHPKRTDRKMLDEIFGDVLPDTTNDERDVEAGNGTYSEQWYLDNRPPHHG